MDKYIGTTLVMAKPMTRQEYCDYRGWQLPAGEKGHDKGYFIEHLNGTEPNHPDHEGYITWVTRKVFNGSYSGNGILSFGEAVTALKQGLRVARAGWNGKGMWLIYVDAKAYDVGSHTAQGIEELLPWIAMKTADNKLVPWLASQTDVLAEDWSILDN